MERRGKDWYRAAGLVALVIVAYLPLLRAGWIWDDDYYVTNNNTLQSVDGLRRIWFQIGAVPQYYPLVHTTFWIENHIFGLWPAGFHADNILLHAMGTLLVWRLLAALDVPAAWVAAAVWAVHPLQVETVGWVTERKNVLCGVFFFASLLSYWKFETSGRRGIYLLALLLFVLAMLSKTIACSMPAVVLLVLWWKRGRFGARDVALLIPFFVIGIGMGMLTGWMEREFVGARGLEWDINFAERCIIAGRAIWFYVEKVLCPWPLVFIYPRWVVRWNDWPMYAYPLGAVAALVVLWAGRSRWGRGPATAALYFVGTLVPALGFVNTLPMRYSFVADHFQYLSGISIIAAIAGRLWLRLPRGLSIGLGCAVIIALVALTWHRCFAFYDAQTLWRDTLAKNRSAWIAHNNLGVILLNRGDLAGASEEFHQAMALKKNHAEARLNLGRVAEKQQKWDEALAWYRDAIRVEPRYAEAYYNTGNVLARLGRIPQAIDAYQQAIALKPDFVAARENLAIVMNRAAAGMATEGKLNQAAATLRRAIAVDPKLIDAHVNLGIVLEKMGKMSEAQEQFHEALRLDPGNVRARQHLAAP